jgi:sulfur carrier protein ThiS
MILEIDEKISTIDEKITVKQLFRRKNILTDSAIAIVDGEIYTRDRLISLKSYVKIIKIIPSY